jgi:glycosyltransferase involved in cell wall biosynthesis
VLALPYSHVFQSGVLFLGYNFGLPVIASDIASFREDIIEGETGFVFPAADPAALATAVDRYFASDLYRSLARRRPQIRAFAAERYAWSRVAEITRGVYRELAAA